jgi:hypothetical protein
MDPYIFASKFVSTSTETFILELRKIITSKYILRIYVVTIIIKYNYHCDNKISPLYSMYYSCSLLQDQQLCTVIIMIARNVKLLV